MLLGRRTTTNKQTSTKTSQNHVQQINSVVVVYTDLSGKKLHRQVCVGTVVTSGSLSSVIVSTPDQNAREVGAIPTLGAIFPIFITPMKLVAVTMILYKLRTVWLLNLPCVMCVCVCVCVR